MEVFSTAKSDDPDAAWEVIKETEAGVVNDTEWEDYQDRPRDEGTLRIVCVSDTHSLEGAMRFKVPDGDVLVHAGDFTNTGELHNVVKFNKWLGELPHKYKVVIAGNHETSFDVEAYPKIGKRFHSEPQDPLQCRAALTNMTHYLENTACEIEGYKFWGSPWSPRFHDWGFNATRGEQCRAIWETIPTDTDVLITHGPPLGHGDLCFGGHRAGCVDLLKEVTYRIKPKLHIFGHVHEGYGVTSNTQGTLFGNASTCNFRYKPVNPPLVFDLPRITKE
eukprot:TRINITY_DN7365_c0_g1_i1.p1 TRINITY_DN7365_c0_g1~~TRINITY_DN7365_c0_g1_i1.p1  ORF type:complete len:291 (+),score=79.70 TRINITY_DN7365_c0_g1_i1:44-874(+)